MGIWMLPPQRPSLDADLKPVEATMRGKDARVFVKTKDGVVVEVKPFYESDTADVYVEGLDHASVADEDDEKTPTFPGFPAAPACPGCPKLIPNHMEDPPRCYICARPSPTSLRRDDGTMVVCCPGCAQDIGYELLDVDGNLKLKPVP